MHEPLSREQCKQAAKLFAAEHPLPVRLLRDVKVVQFGSPSKEYSNEDNLVMLNYRSRWADGQSKVVFENRVEEGDGKGPSYNVYAIDANEEGKKLRYPIAKGSSPDDVWNKVAERQRHILHKEKRLQDGVQPCASPGGSSGSVVDGILKKCSHLSSIWGLEKFGFIDLTCLKAMEGQDGVEDTRYKYVNERHGWVQQQIRLRDLLSQRGQKLRLKPRSKPSAENKVIDKVVERLVETMVKKVCTLQEKYEAQVARQEERARKKELKHQENKRRKKEKPATENALIEDTELQGWESMPPDAVPLPSLISSEPTMDESSASYIIEAWLLAYRFQKMLHLDVKTFPSIEEMAKWYYQDGGSGIEMCAIMNAFIEFLTDDLCESALHAILDGDQALKRIDFAPGTRSAHVIVKTPNNWQDVLHRYLFIVAMAAGLSNNEKVHYINYPVEYVHPHHIMESMISGPTGVEVATGDLNPLLPKEAEWRIRARRDALCCLESMKMAMGDAVNGTVDETVRKRDKALRLIFEALFQTVSDSGGKFVDVCFDGNEAALETRLGMPMDFSLVAAKVECLVYQSETDWLNSFASDLFYAWKMLQTALQRESNKFGTEKMIARKQDILKKVLNYIRDIIDYGNAHDLDQLLDKLKSDNAAPAESNEADTSERIPRNMTPSDQHCFICWLNQDQESFEACMSCGKHAHSDCLMREDELGCSRQSKTPGEYLCLLCSSQKHSFMDRREHYIIFPGAYGQLWRLVRDLGDCAFQSWTPSQRVHLLRILSLLLSEHPSVRETLQNEEEKYKKLKKTLTSSRNELKAIQSGKQQDATEEKSIRQAREEEMMKEKLVMRISKAEQDVKCIPKRRMIALGVDRHWNRYWPLPNIFLSSKEPCILVEKVSSPSSEPSLCIYKISETIGQLSNFLNPAGQREHFLKAEIDHFTKDRTAMDDQQEGKTEHDDASMDKGESPMEVEFVSEMDRFKTSLMEFAQGLPQRVYHEIRATPPIQEQWTSGIQSITSPHEALAYIILLERMLDASCFKVHWRLWAVPAPHPLGVATLSAAWNRLENLKKAIKPSINQTYSLSMMAIEDLDDDKRQASTPYDDYATRDEELAKQLDAELNQRRRGRARETRSGREKRPRASLNLRNVSKKYYGEDEESFSESEEESSSYEASSRSHSEQHQQGPSSSSSSSKEEEGEEEEGHDDAFDDDISSSMDLDSE